MRLRSRDVEEESEVMMSPLIDCVFILLIYFLTTSFMQKPHRDLGIVLPTARASEKRTAKYDTIIIEMTAPRPPHDEPVIALDGEEVTLTLLHKRMRQLVLKDPDRRARVDADREIPVREVTRVLDLLQFEGVQKIGIRTKDTKD
jgi:biopolymer transport protein ExbD